LLSTVGFTLSCFPHAFSNWLWALPISMGMLIAIFGLGCSPHHQDRS
jgi:hypothetical protein